MQPDMSGYFTFKRPIIFIDFYKPLILSYYWNMAYLLYELNDYNKLIVHRINTADLSPTTDKEQF